jgi:hypothetical protein
MSGVDVGRDGKNVVLRIRVGQKTAKLTVTRSYALDLARDIIANTEPDGAAERNLRAIFDSFLRKS